MKATTHPDGARRPDYRLRIKDKETSEPLTVGAGWMNKDGSISIQISKLIKIEMHQGVFISLFPIVEGDKIPSV